jgi:hypothetical protein
MVGGQTVWGAVTSSHAWLVTLPSPAGQAFAFPQFPVLTAPAPGAAVDVIGFVAVFMLPPNCLFGMLELRSENAGELLLWEVVVRRDETFFWWVPLQSPAESPVIAGRTYTLTLSAWFGDVFTGSSDPFGDITAFAQSIPPIEAGVTQVASRSIQITTF